ncbi:hypothetical protein ABZ468_29805 [Streptomyces sp. NPDC005708]
MSRPYGGRRGDCRTVELPGGARARGPFGREALRSRGRWDDIGIASHPA